MPWLRVGDTALTHPAVEALADVSTADSRTLLETWGFVCLCATVSAGQLTDGLFRRQTLERVGLTRWRKLTDQAVEAGLLVPHEWDGKPGWKLIDDVDLLHIRSRDEVEFERQRKRDQSNPALTVPVRARDGDACRYCGHIVNWAARTGNRRGSYDHREPGVAATVDTYVVSCYACNSSRKDDAAADARHPLRPAPESPHYSKATLQYLRKHSEYLPASCQALSGELGQPPADQGEGPGTRARRDGTGSGPGRDGRPPQKGGRRAKT